jgi:membrane protein DedA with SNARE-associated domain
MGGWIDRVVLWMEGLPAGVVYLVIGVFAGLENVFPPVPADVIALAGGFLAGRGVGSPWIAFLVVWLSNVATAMLTYALGRRYGPGFFAGPVGRLILQPGQLTRLGAFYARHGAKVIFISRFLPGFRAVVPVFAGTSGLGVMRTGLPIALASGVWYGFVVYLGATAGDYWEEIRVAVERYGRWFALAAVPFFLLAGWWWWRTRGADDAPPPAHP